MIHDFSKRYEAERDAWLEKQLSPLAIRVLYTVCLMGLTALYWYVATI